MPFENRTVLGDGFLRVALGVITGVPAADGGRVSVRRWCCDRRILDAIAAMWLSTTGAEDVALRG